MKLATRTPHRPAIEARLRELVDVLPSIRGAMLGSLDGRAVAAVLGDRDAGATAAIVAASLGLATRMSELIGDDPLQEVVVRSASGYVVLYAVGDRGVLTVLTDGGANLAMVHLRARVACADLAAMEVVR